MDVLVAGGGVIGLSVAWRALREGLSVTVADPAPGSQASRASAGMLPPANELLRGMPDLLRLCLASRQLLPDFLEELEETSGQSTGYRRDGLLDAAFDPQGLASLEELYRWEQSLGIRAERLDAAACRRLEPRLAPGVQGGLFNPDDGAVDPRRLCAALLAAIGRLGGTVLREPVAAVLLEGRAAGLRLADGRQLRADRTVLATGCWTDAIEGVPAGVVPPSPPVKGQILRLRSATPYLRHVTRTLSAAGSLYLVQRLDGELVVGATYEEAGFDTRVTVAGLRELLGKLEAVLPGAGGLELAEASAALRPGSPDGLPVLGRTAVPDLLLAAGHGRIGVQLAPVTAEAVVHALTKDELPEVAVPFRVERFAA